MIRTAVGVSLLVVLTLGGIAACGSSSGDEATGKGGSTGSGGSNNSTGGGTGGTSNGGRAGSASVAGGNGDCTGVENMCLDAQTVQGCNPDTGMIETLDCESDVPDGLINLGCDADSDGIEACLLDFADPICWDGANIFGACVDATQEQVIGYYLGCFHDMNGAHTIIPCFIEYADEATLTVDCQAAGDACLPPELLGGGGAGGGGGAEAGAGGGG